MQVKILDPKDIESVLKDPSKETLKDMEVFGSTLRALKDRALNAYPFAWTIYGQEKEPGCVCWYNVRGDKAVTSMFYTRTFLANKGITKTIKSVIEDNVKIAKEGGIDMVEIHSTLSHPLSESWYQKLGFTKTDRTYCLRDHPVVVFERIL